MTGELPPFVPFGHSHLLMMVVVLTGVVTIPWSMRHLDQRTGRIIARMIAALLFINEIVVSLLDMFVYRLPLAESLPLQLCAISALLTGWMLWQRSYAAFEIVYFWGIGGSIAAMLTPDLSVGFPHPRFFHFFLGHGLIMLGVLYASFVWQFRPVLRSAVKAIIASIVLMLVVGLVNYLLDTNYMYLCAKPAQNTLMDAMGEWPWYLAVLVLAGSVVYLVCLWPFLLLRRRQNTDSQQP